MTLAYTLRAEPPFTERGMGRAGSATLSDHLGVNADSNRRAPHCSPVSEDDRGPLQLAPSPADPEVVVDGTITHPGSMQWLSLAEAGTYSLALTAIVDGTTVECSLTAPRTDSRCPRLHVYRPTCAAPGSPDTWLAYR